DGGGRVRGGGAKAGTCPAGRIDHLAAAMTAWAGAFQCEEPLGMPDFPLPPTGRADLGLGAGLGAISRTGFACDRSRYANLSALTAKGFFEGQLHVVAQIGATLAAGTAAAPTTTHTEKIVEYVGERCCEFRPKARPHALLERRVTKAVIGSAFIAVLKDLIGLVEFLEAMFGVVVARIAIRVEFHGQLAIGGLEIGVVSTALDAKDFVIV